jgi:hypothetical protein
MIRTARYNRVNILYIMIRTARHSYRKAVIISLTLEANPTLTWRDVQHIMLQTARYNRVNILYIMIRTEEPS